MTDPVTHNDLREQSERHHKALSQLNAHYVDLAAKIDSLTGLLAGTVQRRGLIHRVEDLEGSRRTSWVMDRGTKIVDAVLVALVILLLAAGAKGVIRDAVQGGMGPSVGEALTRWGCDSCAISVAAGGD